jgi:hypothetical protein
MRHVAEGDLHAYLDGGLEHYPADEAERIREHLDACASCRERLEEERRSRERAAAVLAGADPGSVEAPPFEELRRRALAREERDASRRSSGPTRVGWLRLAATAVVALGVGWMGGRVLPAGPPVSSVPAAGEAEARPVDDGPAGSDPGASIDGAVRTTDQGVTSERDAAASPERLAETSPERGASSSGRAGEMASRQRVAAADTHTGGVERPAERLVPVDAVPSPATSPARALKDPVHVLEEARVPASMEDVALRTGDSTVRAAAEPEAVESREELRPDSIAVSFGPDRGRPAAPAPVEGPARPEVAERLDRVLPRRGGVDPFAASGDVSSGAQPAVPPSRDLRGTGGLGLTIPGLPVVTAEWTEVAPGVRGFRVVQRLITGDTLELRFGNLDGRGDAPTALLEETLPDGVHQVVEERGAGWVVARAPVSPEEIRALIALLR